MQIVRDAVLPDESVGFRCGGREDRIGCESVAAATYLAGDQRIIRERVGCFGQCGSDYLAKVVDRVCVTLATPSVPRFRMRPPG